MIRATLDGSKILVSADVDDAPKVAKLYGITRTARMAAFTCYMPLNEDSIWALRSIGTKASRELINEAKRIMDVRAFVSAQKDASHIEPIRPVPIRPDVQLYAHQIKGYNIMLALFGYAISSWR